MSVSEQDLRLQDRIHVVDEEGDEREVFNWVSVEETSVVRAVNPTVETALRRIYAGDSEHMPEAVTHWIAEALNDEFNINVEMANIDVIDPTRDEVTVL